MGKKTNLCQLYKYNQTDLAVTKNTPEFFSQNFTREELEKGKVHWLNFHTINCHSEISSMLTNIGVDSLVVEDVYTEKRRPKIEEYDGYIFFKVRSALPAEEDKVLLKQEQISFILGDHFVVSLQEKKSDHFTEVRQRIEVPKGKIRQKDSDFLLYRMLEAIIDNYYEVVDDVAKKANRLEARVLRNPHSNTLKVIEIEKRKVAQLRKLILPMRDITSQIEKSSNPLFQEVNKPYFMDLKDHCLGVLDEIDSMKQFLEGLTNLYYAVQGQRMNEIMKVLTVVSAIFIPLTFLAGIYGMNFDNIPELHVKHAYFYLLGVMAILAIALVVYFKRKGWLDEK